MKESILSDFDMCRSKTLGLRLYEKSLKRNKKANTKEELSEDQLILIDEQAAKFAAKRFNISVYHVKRLLLKREELEGLNN